MRGLSSCGVGVARAFWCAVAAAVAIGLCASPAALAACSSGRAVFASIGAEQCYTVPAGVTSVHVVAVGGAGGGSLGGAGGTGAQITSDVTVTAGQTLYVEVGVSGGSAGFQAGGGGGASDVQTCSVLVNTCLPTAVAGDPRVVVAGGGGGGRRRRRWERRERYGRWWGHVRSGRRRSNRGHEQRRRRRPGRHLRPARTGRGSRRHQRRDAGRPRRGGRGWIFLGRQLRRWWWWRRLRRRRRGREQRRARQRRWWWRRVELRTGWFCRGVGVGSGVGHRRADPAHARGGSVGRPDVRGHSVAGDRQRSPDRHDHEYRQPAALDLGPHVRAGSDPGDFFVGSDGCLGVIATGASCSLTVRLAPQASGARSATLEIASNDPNGPATVALSGTGGQLPQGPTGASGATGATGASGATAPAAPRARAARTAPPARSSS